MDCLVARDEKIGLVNWMDFIRKFGETGLRIIQIPTPHENSSASEGSWDGC
jgi:hypothetical protein